MTARTLPPRDPESIGPFTNVLRLFSGDFFAKTLNFLAFIFVARTVGVDSYGVLEFAVSLLTYALLIADAGLEVWATREAAQGEEIPGLVGRVVPLRLILALVTYAVILGALPLLPDYTGLAPVLSLFGLTVLVQAVDTKWVFMGQEKLGRVARGLALAQTVFAAVVFALVRGPQDLVWIPIARLAGDVLAALFFARRFVSQHGNVRLDFSWHGAGTVLSPALTMGAARTLAVLNYNFDSVLLGFLAGAAAVGWYSAAYKPVTVLLAMPVTYFVGIFPALSRTYRDDRARFGSVIRRSLELTAAFAAPIGVAGAFFAEPVIALLYGPAYRASAPALQVLAWSASLVILRGTYRQAFNAAGQQGLDLRCAAVATAVNVGLNLVLIPPYGIIGAAVATVISETIWLSTAAVTFAREVLRVNLLRPLLRPVVAAAGMGAYLLLGVPGFWPARAVLGGLLYAAILLALHPEFLSQLSLPRTGSS